VADEPELQVADAIGKVMAFWGFRRNLGRIWSLLYLSPVSLTAPELCEQLSLSTGSVSMALTELQRWGAVVKVHVAGDRRDHYEAERDVWKLVSSVMAQREIREIEQAVSAFEGAERQFEARVAAGGDGADEAAFRLARVRELEELSESVRELLRLLLGQASVDDIVRRGAPKAPPEPLLRIPRAPEE
jgi:DNA-binding transcriptional regulator GbsR (MarR family)